MRTEAYLGLGSNLGDRRANIELGELSNTLAGLREPNDDAPRRALEQARRTCCLLVELGLG